MFADSPIPETRVRQMADLARAAMRDAHAPYSDYQVGACVMDANGNMYTGCNIEVKPTVNTLHAEQRAAALALEADAEEIVACALITSGDNMQPPCGNCRNVLATLNEDMAVFVVTDDGIEHHALDTLLPHAYTG